MFRTRLIMATYAASLFVGAATGFAALPSSSPPTAAENYLADAQRELAAGNLRAAEIQLKNAALANPSNPAIRLLLADVYIRLANFPAAQGEVELARRHGAKEEDTAPLLARALLYQGKFSELFQQVHPGNRSAPQESAVRAALGLAHLVLGETDQAAPLLQDAERLDPNSIDAKLGAARLLMARRDTAGAESRVDAVLARAPKRPDALDLKGQILTLHKKFDEAMARFDEVIAMAPNDIEAHIGRANVLVSQGKLDGADKDLDAVFAVQPRQLQASYLRAFILAKQGQYQPADDVLQKVNEQLGSFPAALYLAGAIKYELKQYEQADSLLAKVIARQPDNAQARRLLARVALVERDPARARNLLEPVIAANPKDLQALTLIAEAYRTQGKLDEALDYYQRAATLRPEDAAMQTNLAVMRLDAGKVDEGLAQLEGLTRSAEGAKTAGPVLVLSALRLGNVTEAASAAEALVKDNPDSEVNRNLLGMVRTAQKDYPGAEKIFTDLIQKHPDFLAARRNLGTVYMISNRLEDAEKTYKGVLDKNPSDLQALGQLAAIAARENKLDRAVEWLKRAQDAAPKDPSPGIDLMRIYAGQKQWQAATSLGQDLMAKFPANAAVVEALGAVQAGAGKVQDAVATYQHLTELQKNSPRAYEEYARALVKAKSIPEARVAFKQAIALAPKNRAAEKELVDLDYQSGGASAALETAASFAKDDFVGSKLFSAAVLERAGRQADATALLAQTQQEHPDTEILIALAVLKQQQGQAAAAEQLLSAWLKDHKDDLSAKMALAESHLSNNQYDLALTEFEELSKQAPTNPVVLNDLSWLYQQKKDPRAHSTAEKAYALAPTSPAIADTLGWILVDGGETTAGLPYLKQAATLLTNDMDVQYHLAVALERSGQSQDAKALLERIMASKQSFKSKADAQKLLDQLQHG
jgi:putative PEP-CTERM system TPR-repeat lipoprotein